jgi:hypothetical protein
VSHVVAGLAAVHKQKLVHRDIKPSNIMVSLEEGGAVTAKIIDLGLAKTVDESASEAGISSPGAFVGTPEFASPEQFAGVDVDIRSDLYSLGVTLWVMVTGQTPFRGPSAEVMYQHQHAPLPLERLKDIPQPVAVLLEKLLEKDPAHRFRTPNELLKAIPRITGAIDARRRITRQSLRETPCKDSRAVTRKPPARLGPKKVSVARLPVTGSDVFGREEDIAFLDDAWANQHVNVVTIVAWAGVGKSTLVNHWLRRMAAEQYRSAQLVFGWSFYRQVTSGGTSSADEFIDAALAWFGDPDPRLRNGMGEGRETRKARCTSSNVVGSGWPRSSLTCCSAAGDAGTRGYGGPRFKLHDKGYMLRPGLWDLGQTRASIPREVPLSTFLGVDAWQRRGIDMIWDQYANDLEHWVLGNRPTLDIDSGGKYSILSVPIVDAGPSAHTHNGLDLDICSSSEKTVSDEVVDTPVSRRASTTHARQTGGPCHMTSHRTCRPHRSKTTRNRYHRPWWPKPASR